MNQEILNTIIKVLVAILSVIITSVIIPWIKSKIDSTKYNDFLSLVKKCVEAANQLYTIEEWAEKKVYVLGLASNYCIEHGVNITADELNAIIEGFVIAVKKGE